jgi:fimbrial isopeptide formation D2 family protein/LPXTG-motif cell wall-anchored protein
MAGSTITITLGFDVSVDARGVITNTANYYLTPKDGQEPEDPTDDDEEEVKPELTVTYVSTSHEAGTVPVDTTEYESGDTVTVMGNTGNLVRRGYEFRGWTLTDGSTTVDYEPGDTFLIDTPVVLYAAWRRVSREILFTKTSAQSGYATTRSGNTITYTISLEIPGAQVLDTWDKLRVVDEYPAGKLTFNSAKISYNTASAQPTTPTSVSAGSIQFVFSHADLLAHAGSMMNIELTFTVVPGTTGTIANDAYYYITEVDSEDPTDPDGEAHEEVPELIPVDDFKKTHGGAFKGKGAEVDFTVSFTLPADTKAYAGLLLIDRLPATLTYGSASVWVNGVKSTTLTATESNGVVSLYLTKTNLNSLSGATIELKINAKVSNSWTSGNIRNDAEIYYQTNWDDVPDPTSDTADETTYVVVPHAPAALPKTGDNSPTLIAVAILSLLLGSFSVKTSKRRRVTQIS